jgi:hypothetical protein
VHAFSRAFVSKLVKSHVNATASKGNPLCLQEESLFKSSFSWNLDEAAGSYHPLPRQAACVAERPCNLPGASWISRCSRYSAITGNLAPRNPQNRGDDLLAHPLWVSRTFARTFQTFRPLCFRSWFSLSADQASRRTSHGILPRPKTSFWLQAFTNLYEFATGVIHA